MDGHHKPPIGRKRMYQLDEALDRQIRELDTVLLRLTTLRLLMATGKHRMVDRAAEELEDSMSSFEAAEEDAFGLLQAAGFSTLEDAAASRAADERPALERRASRLRSLHRDVRVALASTGAAAERSVRLAAQQLGGPTVPMPRMQASNPFFTEG